MVLSTEPRSREGCDRIERSVAVDDWNVSTIYESSSSMRMVHEKDGQFHADLDILSRSFNSQQCALQIV